MLTNGGEERVLGENTPLALALSKALGRAIAILHVGRRVPIRSHCKSKHRRHPTHHTVKHLPDVGWSQNLDLPPSAARPALPRGEITRFPPPRSACSRPFLAVFIQILKKNGPRETAAATLPRLCRRAPGRLPQPVGIRGRPLTDFGQPPPASSRAAPGTPAWSLAACCVARFWAVSPQKRLQPGA